MASTWPATCGAVMWWASLEAPNPVTRASGRTYPRHNIPAEGSAAHMAALDAADPGEHQVARARYWHPRT